MEGDAPGGNRSDKVQEFTNRVAAAFTKAREIVTEPGIWTRLRDEPETIKGLYKNYILILAALPPLAQYLHSVIIGAPIFRSLVYHLFMYLMYLVNIYISSVVIAKIAPKFGGKEDLIQSLKLVSYTMTPGFLASVFILVPWIGPLLTLVGLYGLYLFYVANPIFLGTPEDKNILFCIVSLVCCAIAGAIIASVIMGLAVAMGARGFPPLPFADGGFDLRQYQR
jgi:hypothetical protein